MSISFHNLTTGSEHAFVPDPIYTKIISVSIGDKVTLSYNPTSGIIERGISKVEFHEEYNNGWQLVQVERAPPYVISGNNGDNFRNWKYKLNQTRYLNIIIYGIDNKVMSEGKFKIMFTQKQPCCQVL